MSAHLSTNHVDTLTSIRFFAAMWVLLGHFSSPLLQKIFPTQFFLAGSSKGAGVSLFFVLSGFILAYTYFEKFKQGDFKLNYKNFIVNRFARIYPLHIACLLFLMTPYDLFKVDFWTNVFLVQGWGFFGSTSLTYNLVAWSISVELFCYLILPFLLFLLKKINRTQLIGIFLIFSFILLGDGWMRLHAFISPSLPSLTIGSAGVLFHGFSIFFHAQCFVLGVLLYPLVREIRAGVYWDLGCIFSLIMILICFHHVPAPDSLLNVAHLIYALLIASLYRTTGIFQKIFSNSILVYLGEISFSIYMLHLLAYERIAMLTKSVLGNGFDQATFNSFYPLLILPFAAVTYHFFELPARNFLRNAFASGHKLKPQFS